MSVSPPIRRRRSSFFERRESLTVAVPHIKNNCDPEDAKKIQEKNLKLYMTKLETESSAWKTLYRDRKDKSQRLKRKLDRDDNVTAIEDSLYNLLSSDILSMLQNKPNLSEITKGSIEFCKEWELTVKLQNELNMSNRRIYNNVKKSVDDTKKSVLEKSLIDIK